MTLYPDGSGHLSVGRSQSSWYRRSDNAVIFFILTICNAQHLVKAVANEATESNRSGGQKSWIGGNLALKIHISQFAHAFCPMLIINLKPSHVIRLGCIFCSRSFSTMPRNVEIKARLPNPVKSSEIARELSGTEGKIYRHVACTHAQILRACFTFRWPFGPGRHIL